MLLFRIAYAAMICVLVHAPCGSIAVATFNIDYQPQVTHDHKSHSPSSSKVHRKDLTAAADMKSSLGSSINDVHQEVGIQSCEALDCSIHPSIPTT